MISRAVKWLSLDFQPELPDSKGPLSLSWSLMVVLCGLSQAPVPACKVAPGGLHVAEFLLSVALGLDCHLCPPLPGAANTPVLSPQVCERYACSPPATCGFSPRAPPVSIIWPHLTARQAGKGVHPPLCPGKGKISFSLVKRVIGRGEKRNHHNSSARN